MSIFFGTRNHSQVLLPWVFLKSQNAIPLLTARNTLIFPRLGVNLWIWQKKQGVGEIEDLLALDYFIWKDLQIEPVEMETPIEENPEKETEKQKAFVHNDVRDRIRDIGSFLGFRAEVEKKVADGAVVDAIWEVSVGNMGRITYVFEVQTSGSIDSLLLNLMKAKNNPSVQGIVAVSDAKQLEKIKKEASSLKGIRDELKFWDYNDVLKVFDALSNAYEAINSLGLVPSGLF